MKNKVTIGPDDWKIKLKNDSYNLKEMRGYVIEELNRIESKLNKVIVDYYQPAKSKEFEEIVLNSSIVSTGAKLKILTNIDTFDNKAIEKVRLLISIRNAFAHAPITNSAKIIVKNNNDKMDMRLDSLESNLTVMNSSGLIKKKSAHEHFKEYLNLIEEIDSSLKK